MIMDFTPYDKDAGAPQHRWFAEHGYDVLVCDARGSGDSPGDYVSWFQSQEALDNYDVVEWLAAQPNSNGRIAQVGASYGSITAYRVAALRPPHLTTIIPMVSPTNIYAEWIYPGGAPSHTNMAWWSNELPVIDTATRASTLQSFQQHPLYDDFWKQIATTNKLSDITVPALHIGGYFDIFKAGGFDALAQRPDSTWLLTGPWIHNDFLSLPGAAPNTITTGTLLQWLDHWLEDRPGTAVPPARVISYESNSAVDTGRWTAFDRWPAESAQTRRLFPTADEALSDTPPTPSESRYSVDPYDGPSAALLGSHPTDPGHDQAESEQGTRDDRDRYSRDPRATFTLPPFENDTIVAGPVTLHLNASLTTDDTYFASKLEVVTTDGKVLPIEAGHLRAQLRNDLEHTAAVTPGEPTQYRIELGNTHWKFKTGEQLRITLSGGDLPLMSPTAPGGVVTIHHGDSTFVEVTTIPA